MMIGRRSLILALSSGLVASKATAQGGVAEWQVREQNPDGRFWVGTWRQREPNSYTFDANWRDSLTGGTVTDVIELRSWDGATVTLYRFGIDGTYTGDVSADGRSIRGTASWYQRGAFWTAIIQG
jgi:hypothetical protein